MNEAHDKLRLEVVDDDMAEMLRRKTPAQRLASAHRHVALRP
jgi:hypothetical protein